MADEQFAAGASPGTAKPASAGRQADAVPVPDAEHQQETGKPDLDEVKRKFREALERKRGRQAGANADGAQDTGKVHGSHGPAASRRSFRRKSG
jgi:hypothetical protein